MGTERITTAFVGNKQTTLHHKFSHYDRYLKSFRYAKTYADYGEFRSFTLLFVTQQEARIENTRRELLDFPIGGFSPPEGRLARGFKPPAFSRFLFQSAVKSAESF